MGLENLMNTMIGIDISRHAHSDILVGLSGEFDVRDLKPLRNALGNALSSKLPTGRTISK
jgi:hypothetical protein